MDHVPYHKAEQFTHGNVTSWEYITLSETMNVARIIINGRYPDSGFTTNQEVDSIVHVIGGDGRFGMQDGGSIELAQHDQVHIAVGDAYYFEGNLEIIYSATPKWTPEQTTQTS